MAFNKKTLKVEWSEFIDDNPGVGFTPRIANGRLMIVGNDKYLHIWEGADGFLVDE